MSKVIPQSLTLEEFLKLPETKPASEYINGEILIKSKLCNSINDVAERSHIAYAFSELRCSFGTRSIVPDVAVFKWSRIPFAADGEAPNDFLLSPDWTIEILSPEQSSNRVTGNILYCLDHGCELGWLIDPEDRSILIFRPHQQPELLQGDEHLPVLAGIELELTVAQVFSWLKMSS
jgi:Uma2 family endonuclease